MSRFAGYPAREGGLWVLDTWTGEVVYVPLGGAPQVIRAAVATPGEGPAFTPFPTPEAVAEALAPPQPESDPLDQLILEAFPVPVATVWQSFLDEPDPRQRCKLLVDAFTLLLKLWAFQAAAEYFASGLRQASVNQTLERDFRRPLISSWNLMLRRTLPVLEDAGVEPFCPELRSVYDEIEAKCTDRVAVNISYEGEDGAVRTRVTRLGKISALIRYRNGLAHGFHQSHEKAAADLERWVPVVRDIFSRARFVTRYPWMARDPSGAGVIRLMGASPPGEIETLPTEVTAPVCLWDPKREKVLPLPVLAELQRTEARPGAAQRLRYDALLFEGVTRRGVVYVGARDGARVEKQTALEPWKSLLAARGLERRATGPAQLDFQRLHRASEAQFEATSSELVLAGKYLPGTLVEREDLGPSLERFEHGDYRGLVLRGDGGSGKTTTMLHAAERGRRQGDLVVFLRGSAIGRPDLGPRILRELSVHDLFFEDFLEAMDPIFAQRPDRRLRVFIDGIEEHPHDPTGLIRSFDGLVEQSADYPWVRLVASVRTAAYNRIRQHARFRPGPRRRYLVSDGSPTLEVGPLPMSMLAEVYENHRGFLREPDELESAPRYPFRTSTPFSELDPEGSTVRLLRSPLMLRLLLEAHQRRPLPSHLSTSDAFELYLAHAVEGRSASEEGHPERMRFLRALVRHFDEVGADHAEREQLREVSALRRSLENPYRESPYVALLDLGVLREEWEEAECHVRFAFQGLFEHLLAERCLPGIRSADDLRALAARAVDFPALLEALVELTRRLTRDDRAVEVLDALSDALDEDGPAAPILKHVCTELVVRLGRHHDAAFQPLVRAWGKRATAPLCNALSEAFEPLFVAGETDAAAAVLSAAHDDAPPSWPGQAEGALRAARLAHRRGDADGARRALSAAEGSASALTRTSADVALLAAQIASSRGDLDDATRHYREAQRAYSEANLPGAASAALRGLATLAGRQNRPDDQRALTERAVTLARAADDRENLARGLHNLGGLFRASGDLERAKRHYAESLELKRERGDRVGAAFTELNLGNVLFGQGQLDEATAVWENALGLAESTQHVLIEGFALLNLALVARWRRAGTKAYEHATAALRSFERREDPRGMAYAHWLAAGAALDTKELDAATEHCRALDTLRKRVPEDKLRVFAGILEVRLAAGAADRERLETALSELDQTVSSTGATGWDLEDGPFEAYLDGALALRSLEAPSAAAWAAKARALLGDRNHPRAADFAASPAAPRTTQASQD